MEKSSREFPEGLLRAEESNGLERIREAVRREGGRGWGGCVGGFGGWGFWVGSLKIGWSDRSEIQEKGFAGRRAASPDEIKNRRAWSRKDIQSPREGRLVRVKNLPKREKQEKDGCCGELGERPPSILPEGKATNMKRYA